MNILMICFNQVGQGTYIRAFEFARGLVHLGHTVTIMATSRQQKTGIMEYIIHGINIVETPDLLYGSLRSGWDPYNVLSRLKWLKNKSYDLVHAFEARPTIIIPAKSQHKAGVPLVMDWADWFGRDGSVEQRPNPIVRTILRPFETYFEDHYRANANGNSVICKTLFDKAISLGIRSEDISLIPNGFNVPGFKPYAVKTARQRLGISENAFIVGYIGSLFTGDARLMLGAFKHLRAKVPGAQLLHIGHSNYRVQTESGVFETGPIDQEGFSQYLSACDIVWLPLEDTKANAGRFPHKFSNYLAAGKPIVATSVGDIPEYILNEEVGVVCKPTLTGLAESTMRLYEDPPLLMKLSDAALRLSSDSNHSWQARTNQLLELYKKVL